MFKFLLCSIIAISAKKEGGGQALLIVISLVSSKTHPSHI